jgi:hypothetical protein
LRLHLGRPVPAPMPPSTSRRWQEGEACATAVPHEVGRGRRQCCVFRHVASLCFKCFICFKCMFQVFHTDVAKVDRGVAHVVMAIHICFKCMFQMFHLLQMNVANVLSGCCKNRSGCCKYMRVASICCFKCFQVFHMYTCKCFI